MMKKGLLFLFVLWIGLGYIVQAQSTYDSITLDGSSALPLLENNFTQNWNISPAAHLGMRVKYHLGSIQLGIRYNRYSSGNPVYEDGSFDSYFIYVGWEYPFSFSNRLSFAPGLRFGNNYMAFDNPATYPATGVWGEYIFDPHESEFAYELFGRLEYSFTKNPWSLHSTFSYNRTLTYHPMPVSMLSFGISRSFATPSWLKSFFK
ncbi:hypothetical protein LQ318_15765 [Aliifodinibius salicampi]|uniref:Outer membrane protein beta-barrel domain-containing protein n=1 Tax=Fodinibius salicampi TaxID=1920655 RepID=A0ABT3Q2Q4_9BACT|nr:hypothetical protein [Fodinibius salicampi]MCW9714366.1 hypothetical protein [Fodinibius salicampi]